MPKPLVTARYRLVLTFQDVASSVVMPGWQSCLGANPASPLSPDRRPARSHAVTACRHYLTPNSQCQCFATWQLERCGAGCGSRLASASWLVAQFRRRWCAAATANLHNALFCKVSASQSQAPFVGSHRFAPCGFTKPALCKLASAGAGASAACTPQPLRVLRAGALSPLWCAGTWVLVSCFASLSGLWPAAMYLVLAPAHPSGLALLRSFARAVCPSAPQRGLPQNRAKTRRLTAAACWDRLCGSTFGRPTAGQ